MHRVLVFYYFLYFTQFFVTAQVVNTSCGQVQGNFNGNGYSFKGIPYALPPVGNRRWQPPVPLDHTDGTCWKGTYIALKFGNTCFQRDSTNPQQTLGSEDCLYLNVWTPTINVSSNLPVMVWIHGGGLQVSNANWPTNSPTEELASDTNVVYVGMNYRLNAFGFMALDILSAESPHNTSGNYGFMDQILALRWTRENIKNFGGDPNQVTVYGQSSGGTSVFALLASPLARGLFQKAWMLSASPILNKTTTEAAKGNEIFLRNIGCNNVSCLLGRTSQQVLEALDAFPYWEMSDQTDLPRKNHFDGAVAVVDGYVVEKPPFQAWEDKTAVDIPLLIGTTAQETDFSPAYSDMKSWTWSDYQNQVDRHLSTFGKEIVQRALNYYPTGTDTPEYQYTSMGTDIRVGCPNDVMTGNAANGSENHAYRYVATSIPSSPINILGMPFPSSYSFHMWDMFAYYGSIKDYIKPLAQSDIMFQTNIRREVLSFIKTGKPFSTDWLPFPQSTALLSETTNVTDRYHMSQCDFWLANGFFNYAWIN